MNYLIKNVAVKKDLNGKAFAYSIIVCPKSNPDYTTSFCYTVEDAKSLNILNEQQAMALVGQPCQVIKSLSLH